MRDRHFPRVCGRCHAPMARQEDACWRCGTRWASEDRPRTALHAVAEGPSEEPRVQTERWIDEGGRFDRRAV
jgi:predicted amidophosphoribosyltransferase